jgi:hypothetical protein
MDPSGHYPEPFGEALSHSSQRATQLTSLVAAAAEVAIRLKAARAARQAAQDEQARRALDEQERTARAQARAKWAPAHDVRWLAQADLHQARRDLGRRRAVGQHRPRRGIGDAQERGTPPHPAPVRDGPL